MSSFTGALCKAGEDRTTLVNYHLSAYLIKNKSNRRNGEEGRGLCSVFLYWPIEDLANPLVSGVLHKPAPYGPSSLKQPVLSLNKLSSFSILSFKLDTGTTLSQMQADARSGRGEWEYLIVVSGPRRARAIAATCLCYGICLSLARL